MRGRAIFGLLRLPFTGSTPPTRDTSQDAATRARSSCDADRRRILQFIRAREKGATDDEIQAGLEMDGNTERPRRVELARAGCIAGREGITRATRAGRPAVVWYFVKGLPPL